MTPGRGPRRAVVLILLVMAGLPCLIGPVISRLYWGYWFDRPAVSGLIAGVSSVERLSRFTNASSYGSPLGPIFCPGALEPESQVNAARMDGEFPYYFLTERVLEIWIRRRVLPTPRRDVRPETLALIEQAVPRLIGDAAGDRIGGWVDGITAEVRAADGRPLVVLALRQGEVRNDHRVYHEVVLDPATGNVVEAGKFYFDVAGLEGATTAAFIVLSAGLVGVVLIGPLAFFAHRWGLELRRSGRGQCPACGYELGLIRAGDVRCPECGVLC